jgi:hypothetical protein
MNLYKKNPKIKGSFFLQGELVDDDTVLAGEKWEMFADPSTFPGRPPKLVKQEFNDLSHDERKVVSELPADTGKIPPRHIGPTTSAAFELDTVGDLKIKSNVTQEKRSGQTGAIRVVPGPNEEELALERADEVVEELTPPKSKSKEIVLDEAYTKATLTEALPGVTKSNVGKVFRGFRTMKELARAGNSDLAKVGVRSNFFIRLREAATNIVEG